MNKKTGDDDLEAWDDSKIDRPKIGPRDVVVLPASPDAPSSAPPAPPALDMRAALDSARAAGVLPHELLFIVAMGYGIEQKETAQVRDKFGAVVGESVSSHTVYADYQTRIKAAKEAAPYFSPKYAAQIIQAGGSEDDRIAAMREILSRLGGTLPT